MADFIKQPSIFSHKPLIKTMKDVVAFYGNGGKVAKQHQKKKEKKHVR
jgi:cytochrome c peroxidase